MVAEKDYLYSDSRDLETIFQREVRKNPWIESHVGVGQQTGQYFVTGEYSYRSKYCSADGLVLAGDAFAFLDPVFSSGVFLALRSGELVADAVDSALTAGDVSAARFTEYGATLCEGIEAMRKLVYAFYNANFSFKDFLMEFPHMKGDLTDCLIGIEEDDPDAADLLRLAAAEQSDATIRDVFLRLSQQAARRALAELRQTAFTAPDPLALAAESTRVAGLQAVLLSDDADDETKLQAGTDLLAWLLDPGEGTR